MSASARFVLVMLLHTTFAAGVYLIGKPATVTIPIPVLALFRGAVAAVGFLGIARARGLDLAGAFRADRRAFLLAAFLGVAVNQVVFLYGLRYTLGSHAALLYALTPTLVLLIGWVRGVERPSLRKAAGIALAFGGVLALFLDRAGAALPPRWLLGDLLVLAAVLAWAAYTVASRPLSIRHGAATSTALVMLLGFAMMLPLGCLGLAGFRPSGVPAAGWVGAVYLGVVASVVMYLLWVHALSLKEPSRVAIAANGQPVLTALLAWAFLGQPVTPHFLLGAALVVSGVVLSHA
ncbi:DMT family transporter [Mesoterricola sediminis]|uniref:Membrane protein n=1 Tax=Mesoterricola sediminis TaxID=2927980 RepID=A0AA48GV32_9BACT|nr:DMT family transporter [Mesoterricola sediminis]BDU76799.1 membrane protein [Mesoterricola sediminis]